MARILSMAVINSHTERQQVQFAVWKERVTNCETDPRADVRKRQHECPFCFYLRSGGLVGQAFTDYDCALCGEKNSHPNTGVPKICDRCAEEQDLCRRCMGTVTGKLLRTNKGRAP